MKICYSYGQIWTKKLLLAIRLIYNEVALNNSIYIQDLSDNCDSLSLFGFNVPSTATAAILILCYMFIFWRRSFHLGCLYGRPGLPSVTSPIKKTDRAYSALVYGVIATEVNIIFFTGILNKVCYIYLFDIFNLYIIYRFTLILFTFIIIIFRALYSWFLKDTWVLPYWHTLKQGWD